MKVDVLLAVLGTYIFCDGLSSLYTYTNGDKAHNQSWLKDHSFRIARCLVGIAIIIIGWVS